MPVSDAVPMPRKPSTFDYAALPPIATLLSAAEVDGRKQLLLDIFVGTTIERVIRRGTFPVLMVNNEAQRRYEKIVAAIDMSDTSANALRTAVTTLAPTKRASTATWKASVSGQWLN